MKKSSKYYPKPIKSVIRWFNALMIITIVGAILSVITVSIKNSHSQNAITVPSITMILTIIAIITAIWSIEIELKKVYPNSNIHNIIIVYVLTFLIVSATFLNLTTMLLAPNLFKTSISLLSTESTILLISLSAITTIMSIFFTFNDDAEDTSLMPIIIGFIPYVIDAILITGIILFNESHTPSPAILVTLATSSPLALYLTLLAVQKIEL